MSYPFACKNNYRKLIEHLSRHHCNKLIVVLATDNLSYFLNCWYNNKLQKIIIGVK